MNTLFDLPTVTYTNGGTVRFRQYAKDPLPVWAQDVCPGKTDRELVASAKITSSEVMDAVNARMLRMPIEQAFNEVEFQYIASGYSREDVLAAMMPVARTKMVA